MRVYFKWLNCFLDAHRSYSYEAIVAPLELLVFSLTFIVATLISFVASLIPIAAPLEADSRFLQDRRAFAETCSESDCRFNYHSKQVRFAPQITL